MADEVEEVDGQQPDPAAGASLPLISLPGYYDGPAAKLGNRYTLACNRYPPLATVAGTLNGQPALFDVRTLPGFDPKTYPYVVAYWLGSPADLDFRFDENSQFL